MLRTGAGLGTADGTPTRRALRLRSGISASIHRAWDKDMPKGALQKRVRLGYTSHLPILIEGPSFHVKQNLCLS